MVSYHNMGCTFVVCIVLISAVTINAVTSQNDYQEPGDGDDNGPAPDGESEVTPPDTSDVVEVETTHGLVRGHVRKGTFPVLSFIDIPYGQFVKFEAPLHVEPWTEIHDAKDHTKICPQLDEFNEPIGSNDCLVLSVFTPVEFKFNESSVLFHIHDGNFVDGSGDFNIYGPEYLVEQGIILVLPNYRLGPLGFLCLQDEVAAGNAALKDLTLALNWVKYNIANFGGNPDKVTVSAEGRAGALVGLLALSHKSNQLFKQAITESGAILAPWALDRKPTDTGLKLVKAVTDTKNTSTLLDLEISKIMQAAIIENITFTPCVERGSEAFINETPWSIINKESFVTDITFMLGSADMSGMQKAVKLDKEKLKELNNNIDRLIPPDLCFKNNATGKALVAKKIKELYFKDKDISDDTRKELTLLYTDSEYLGPSLRLARILSKAGGKIYLYEFACDGERNVKKLALNTTMAGAARGDIIGYVFMQNENKPNENEEQLTPVLFLDLWATFIINGKPSAQNLKWEPLTKDKEPVMIINKEPKLEDSFHPNRMNIWSKIYDQHFVEHNSGLDLLPSHIIIVLSYIVYRMF